jgi:hypothetical protein
MRHSYHTKPTAITQQWTAQHHRRTTLPEEITLAVVKTIQWHHHASMGYRRWTLATSIRFVAARTSQRIYRPSNIASMGFLGVPSA